MRIIARRDAILILILITEAAGSAQVYRWVDEAGVLHLSDRPPPEAFVHERLDVEPIATTRFTALPTRRPGRDEVRAVDRRRAAARRVREAREARELRCKEMREELSSVENRLREGYTAAEAASLDARKRDLRLRILREC